MPHPVVHAEIRSTDPDATREFFAELFGWGYSDGALPRLLVRRCRRRGSAPYRGRSAAGRRRQRPVLRWRRGCRRDAAARRRARWTHRAIGARGTRSDVRRVRRCPGPCGRRCRLGGGLTPRVPYVWTPPPSITTACPVIGRGGVGGEDRRSCRRPPRARAAGRAARVGERGLALLGRPARRLDDPLDRALRHVGAHERRAHRVDANARSREFARHRPGEPDGGVFGGGVRARVWGADAPVRRGDGDDHAAAARSACRARPRACTETRPVTLTSKWASHESRLVRASGALSAIPALLTSTSTVVDLGERLRHRLLVGDVAHDGLDLPAAQAAERGLVTPERDDLIAECRELHDDRPPDSLRPAGDDDRAAHRPAANSLRAMISRWISEAPS